MRVALLLLQRQRHLRSLLASISATGSCRSYSAAAAAACSFVHAEDAAVASKLGVGAAKGDGCKVQQAECTGTHDAGLTGDVQVAPAATRVMQLEKEIKHLLAHVYNSATDR